MTIAEYSLEDEERFLKSYLERTTAVCANRQDGIAEQVNASNDDGGSNRDENCNQEDDEFIGRRVYCCKTSRSLYCPECCRVLVPKHFWPHRFIHQQSKNVKGHRQPAGPSFPFQSMDIVLGVKERRTSSTGIQMMCISNMIAEAAEMTGKEALAQPRELSEVAEDTGGTTTTPGCKNDDDVDCSDRGIDDSEGGEWWKNVNLYDLNRGDTLPQYKVPAATDEEGTYVLFPQEGKSVPISAVANKIKKLVVLDIKWTRSYHVQLFSADHHKITVSRPGEGGGGTSYNPLAPLKDLPFVHLEYPPQNSNFWRWHNRGNGMLSTIEAIYFAAREASATLQHRRDIGEDEKYDNGSNYQQQDCVEECDEDKTLIDILWLFALQRSIIQQRSLQEGRPVAFSEEAKAIARALRKQGSLEA